MPEAGIAPRCLRLPSNDLPDWRARWDAVYAFIEDWRGTPFRPAPATAEIARLETVLGIHMPPSMREWLSFVHSCEQIADSFSWRDDLTVERLADHDAVSLLLQGEGDACWAVKSASVQEADPPVTVYMLDQDFYDEKDPKRQRFVEADGYAHLSEFAFQYLLRYFRTPLDRFGVYPAQNGVSRSQIESDFGPATAFGRTAMFLRPPYFLWHDRENEKEGSIGCLQILFQEAVNAAALPPSLTTLLNGMSWCHSGSRAILPAPRKPWWRRWF